MKAGSAALVTKSDQGKASVASSACHSGVVPIYGGQGNVNE